MIYTFVMFAVTLGPFFSGLLGGFYLASAIVLGGIFIALSWRLYRNPAPALILRTYLYSLVYLALLFVAMAVDAVA